MNDDALDRLLDAVLFEGYLLYPYRRTALKNRLRAPLGTLYPEAFCLSRREGDAWSLHSECLAVAPPQTPLAVRLRFLQLTDEDAGVQEVRIPPTPLDVLTGEPARYAVDFPPIAGELTLAVAPGEAGALRIQTTVRNTGGAPGLDALDRDAVVGHAMVAPHLVLELEASGGFISLIDPPDHLRDAAAACRNNGTWPVLLGSEGATNRVLSAPIVLYDYPRIAPESGGDFFDATEIDELLTLRVLTLTDEEKRDMAADPRGRELLERTERGGLERLGALHGAIRAMGPVSVGARVRLRPSGRADIFDLLLRDKTALVTAVERDFEGRFYVAVRVDDDPGGDLGAYGHRFFFRPEELEAL